MPSRQAALFDLDGTLLDTLDDIADSMNAVLETRGYPPHTLDAYRVFIGEGIETLVFRAFPAEARDPSRIADGVSELRREYENRWDHLTRPYPGVLELLETLGRRNVPAAILSNKPHDFTLKSAKRFFPGYPFVAVRGIAKGTPAKPDPAAALEIARTLRCDPAHILYLGDTKTDMETALRAGMYPVGALWGFRDAGELESFGAKRLAASPLEVLSEF
jgi:phosphoglycolate phosphatase